MLPSSSTANDRTGRAATKAAGPRELRKAAGARSRAAADPAYHQLQLTEWDLQVVHWHRANSLTSNTYILSRYVSKQLQKLKCTHTQKKLKPKQQKLHSCHTRYRVEMHIQNETWSLPSNLHFSRPDPALAPLHTASVLLIY